MIRILIILLTCLSLKAGTPISLSDTSWPNLATSLPCSANLVHWWVASDLTDGAVSTWTDRIGGLAFTQATGANQPTKTTSWVTFAGSHFMYNSPKVTVGGQVVQRTVVIIYKPAGNAANPQSLWVDGDLGAFGFMISLGGDNKLRWFGGSPDEILVNSNINNNTLHDFIMNWTGTDGGLQTIWDVYLD
jgi:hypothetical protein